MSFQETELAKLHHRLQLIEGKETPAHLAPSPLVFQHADKDFATTHAAFLDPVPEAEEDIPPTDDSEPIGDPAAPSEGA
jgi:hypothetical protein